VQKEDEDDEYEIYPYKGILTQESGLTFVGTILAHPIYGSSMDVGKVLNDNGIPYYILVPQ